MKVNKGSIAMILAFLVILSGCGRMVDSYMDFTITQFEEFLAASDEKKVDYVTEGKLDFAKTGEVYFVPFIKETTHEECTLFVYAYWTEPPEEIAVTEISLVSPNDVTVFCGDFAAENMEIMWQGDVLSEGVIEIGSFPKSEAWFSNGNQLCLSFCVSVSTAEGTVCSDYEYEITLAQRKSVLLPT